MFSIPGFLLVIPCRSNWVSLGNPQQQDDVEENREGGNTKETAQKSSKKLCSPRIGIMNSPNRQQGRLCILTQLDELGQSEPCRS